MSLGITVKNGESYENLSLCHCHFRFVIHYYGLCRVFLLTSSYKSLTFTCYTFLTRTVRKHHRSRYGIKRRLRRSRTPQKLVEVKETALRWCSSKDFFLQFIYPPAIKRGTSMQISVYMDIEWKLGNWMIFQ